MSALPGSKVAAVEESMEGDIKTTTNVSSDGSPLKKEGSEWILMKDDKSEHSFYYNMKTSKTSWINPKVKHDILDPGGIPVAQLVKAAEEGDLDELEHCIEAGANLNAAHDGYTPLLMASFCGQLYAVEMLIEACVDINANSQDDEESNALHCASQSKDIEMAELLIRHKAAINAQSKKGTTPLLLAAQEDAFDLVQRLIDLKADCEISDANGVTPFYYAANENNVAMAELLIKHKANITHVAKEQLSPFEVAVKKNNIEVVQLLMDSKCSAAQLAVGEHAPALTKLISGELEMLALLLKHGLDAESTDSKGWTAFLIAARGGDHEAINILGPYANVNRINPVDGECALSLAVHAKNLAIVTQLLNLSCDVNALNPSNLYTPLHLAAEMAENEILLALLDRGANVNDKTSTGATPIMLAVQNRHSRTVQKLVQHQANIEMYDRAKQTPIVIAINNSDRATVQSLCKAPPKWDRKNAQGRIPLEHAIYVRLNRTARRVGALAVVKTIVNATSYNLNYLKVHAETFLPRIIEVGDLELLKYVAPHCDLSKADNEGYTPLLVAVENDRQNILQYLLNIDSVDLNLHLASSSFTALHLACQNGFTDIATQLLYAGIDVNAKSSRGITALFQAAQAGLPRIVKEILDHGINVKIDDALMCAVDEGNYACAELLLRKRASVSKTTKSGINAMTLAIRCQKSPKNGSQSIFKLLQHYNALLPDIEKVILNAPKMQGIVRGFLIRSERKTFWAATVIQSSTRAFLTRRKHRHQNYQALQIGRAVRGFIARRRLATQEKLRNLIRRIRRKLNLSFAMSMSMNQKEKAATMLAAIVRGSKSRADAERKVTAALTIQKNWWKTRMYSYANAANKALGDANKLFASLRQETHQTNILLTCPFLQKNLPLLAVKTQIDANWAISVETHLRLMRLIYDGEDEDDIDDNSSEDAKTVMLKANSFRPAPRRRCSVLELDRTLTGSLKQLTDSKKNEQALHHNIMRRSKSAVRVRNGDLQSRQQQQQQQQIDEPTEDKYQGYKLLPELEQDIANFKRSIVLYNEQAKELTRLSITASIEHLRASVEPMGEVLRSGQLQKHLPPSIVKECDVQGTWAKLNTAQGSVDELVRHCECESIQSKLLVTRAQDHWAKKLEQLCDKIVVIDGQIETMLQQAKDVEVRINKLSERLHLAQRVRQQTKYKHKHFDREHKRFMAMCRIWWKVGRALRKHEVSKDLLESEDQHSNLSKGHISLSLAVSEAASDSHLKNDETKCAGIEKSNAHSDVLIQGELKKKNNIEENESSKQSKDKKYVTEWNHNSNSLMITPVVPDEVLDPWTAAQRGISVERFSKIIDREHKRAAKLGNICFNLNQQDVVGATLLNIVAWKGHSHLVQYLLDHTLPVDPKDKLGAAVAKRHRVDIDKVDHRIAGNSPILLAARAGHHKVVQILLSRGALMDKSDMLGNTILHYAARSTSMATVDLILAYEPGKGRLSNETVTSPFWRLVCTRNNKNKYAHEMATTFTGEFSMLSKKLEWLFERAPAELIPVGTKQKMAKKVKNEVVSKHESPKAMRERLMKMALDNLMQEDSKEIPALQHARNSNEIEKLRAEGVI